MLKRHGEQTVIFSKPVGIVAASSVVGPKEGEGPLGGRFDLVENGLMFETRSWEAAESKFAKTAVNLCSCKAEIPVGDFEYIIAGDLLNQSTGSIFGLRDTNRPYLGIFGACSAMGEGLSIGGMLIDGGFAQKVMIVASSHFCSAEKQFRFPLEFGSQRPPTSSWTVTGAAAAALTAGGKGPALMGCTTGKIVDMGVKDAHNMGAAMAGAAADTIAAHFRDLGRNPSYYDAIITGDLGHVGQELLLQMLSREGFEIASRHRDCGIEIFDKDTQGTLNGGSGCACSGVVFAAYFYEEMKRGKYNKILFVPTGALMSPTSVQQGESIPGIAHAVIIENWS
ncbi:MAG: stage V sporulation protein AD [Clostridiales bacterium]|jgi:stage V sporulation protein AD|nr:stage V sporulation protein AD [Clostridiales bacterium]